MPGNLIWYVSDQEWIFLKNTVPCHEIFGWWVMWFVEPILKSDMRFINFQTSKLADFVFLCNFCNTYIYICVFFYFTRFHTFLYSGSVFSGVPLKILYTHGIFGKWFSSFGFLDWQNGTNYFTQEGIHPCKKTRGGNKTPSQTMSPSKLPGWFKYDHSQFAPEKKNIRPPQKKLVTGAGAGCRLKNNRYPFCSPSHRSPKFSSPAWLFLGRTRLEKEGIFDRKTINRQIVTQKKIPPKFMCVLSTNTNERRTN